MKSEELRELVAAGQHTLAARRIDLLLQQHAGDPALWEMRAFVALNTGDGEAAVRSLERAVELEPGQVRWQAGLGAALLSLGRLREAELALHRAFRLNPQDRALMLQLAQCLYGLHKPDEAAMMARRLVSLDPVQPAAWRLLGQIALHRGDGPAALRALERASVQAPDDARVQFELAQACVLGEDLRRAHAALERARQLDPRLRPALLQLVHLKQQLGNWEGLVEAQAELHECVRLGLPTLGTALPQVLLASSADADVHRLGAQLTAQAQAREVADLDDVAQRKAPRHGSATALRIGVLAQDFDDHAGTRALVEVVERLRNLPVEVTLFASGRSGSGQLRRRLQALWPLVELQDWPPARAAQRVADAGLHVLLDASGNHGEARSSLPILRPCPLQLAWPGLPAPGGAPWLDGIIGDAVLFAPAQEASWRGTQVHLLEACAVSMDTRCTAVSGLDRAAAGLPADGFVFAHLGGPRYYQPELFDCWARILARVPHGVLWLAGGPGGAWSSALLRDQLLLRGVAGARVHFCLEDAVDLSLARLAHVDLVLDSFPCSAREQASLAALAGVPVLCLPGTTLASRAAASLNVYQQLPDLNCTSVQQYIDTAVAIAHNPAAPEVLRETLKSSRGSGSVLDMQHTAQALYRLLVTLT